MYENPIITWLYWLSTMKYGINTDCFWSWSIYRNRLKLQCYIEIWWIYRNLHFSGQALISDTEGSEVTTCLWWVHCSSSNPLWPLVNRSRSGIDIQPRWENHKTPKPETAFCRDNFQMLLHKNVIWFKLHGSLFLALWLKIRQHWSP